MYHKCAKDENGSSPDGVEQAKRKPSDRVENIGDLPDTLKIENTMKKQWIIDNFEIKIKT